MKYVTLDLDGRTVGGLGAEQPAGSSYGRMAVVRDDQGAALALMSVSEEQQG